MTAHPSRPTRECLVFGPLENEVMRVLWPAPGPMTVREVLGVLNAGREAPLAYTTVMTVLSRLAEKGAANRTKAGRSYAYRPCVTDEAAMAVREVIRDFGVNAVGHFLDEIRSAPDLRERFETLLHEGPGR
ncbi:BlaI/MecI/CopY family transcriptional regulator [Streptomyces aurantiacus]|uniref:BlaI/MecI/CopY family transcriptional regulator n=1 Tax=Streptomyces aurantiacus TaxID=47760 RepID=UPI0006E1707B|nr:BlaI/MecI/CopY family transcriptional regulator [Streptomyces aurantiacus]